MSVAYRAVNWNPQKKRYDLVLAAGVLGTLATFVAVTLGVHPAATVETALIRGLGLTGFLLLHVILSIGPLARIDERFLPLLYNRRHLGVILAILALGHAVFVVIQYHGLGNVHPLVSLLTSNSADVPFESFGIVALGIFVVMAATSHDYWLSILTPPTWKRLHLLVYLAYLALVAHVAFGVLQDERHPLFLIATAAGAAIIGGLHLAAAWRERLLDRRRPAPDWIDVGPAATIAEGRARIALVAGERVAVFRHHDRLSCVSNVCKHQNGPLGEGRIVDGCITCPWHGYQYRPEDGTSPPPFTDRIPTFNLRVEDGRVLVDPRPNAPGTRVDPVPVPPTPPGPAAEFFVGYHPAAPPGVAAFSRRAVVTVLLLGMSLAVAFAVAQETFQPAHFAYGETTQLHGVLRLEPYPVLETEAQGRIHRYLLAGPGKHGAAPLVTSHANHRVRISGTVARHDRLSLLEVTSVAADSGTSPTPVEPLIDLGSRRLEGEVVDGKCYAGVMNPGLGTTHRGCAARCLAGGLPALFVTRDSEGGAVPLILTDAAMAPLPAVGNLAGRRLVLRGRVWRQGDLWFLQADRLPLTGPVRSDPGHPETALGHARAHARTNVR
ncbi:MAG: ferric reductase-like transmembrane domain-containing protein [Gemmatimonadales bacterium]|nr:ferric reductase-like transmembrane domain-containing protein [Gemmatimonadales bacterium]